MQVHVSFTAPAEPPGDRTCLVIDVLRATSVMAVLLARGVRAIYPAPSIEAGRERLAALTQQLNRGDVILCGEEHALPPEDYDYGNSPGEFERVPLPAHAVVATTNGTPALIACLGAPLIMPAAPLNASAVLGRAIEAGHDVLIVCAGLRGAYADDDTTAAGLFVDRLIETGYTPTANAEQAHALYSAAREDLAGALRASEHGQRLVALDFDSDIDLCSAIDRYDVAGALELVDGVPVIRPINA
jgi:2-phosphosulfolactate phosphatase